MKYDQRLKEALIECVCQLTSIELSGLAAIDGNKLSIQSCDYSEQKKILIKMIDDCNEKLTGGNATR